MKGQYTSIARVYDELNAEYDYEGYANYIHSQVEKHKVADTSLALDLACGTGKMTFLLRDLGYDMTGVDISEDMLSIARDISAENEIGDILWLCQPMQEFELYGTVDLCVCCLDSLNYLTNRDDLKRTLLLVRNYLIPDGIFIFDVNTPYRFKNVYGQNDFVSEGDGVLMTWQNDFNEKTGLCKFYLNFFEENEDGSYTRSQEVQSERCYSMRQILSLLKECGFEVLDIHGSITGEPYSDNDEKWYFTVRNKKD